MILEGKKPQRAGARGARSGTISVGFLVLFFSVQGKPGMPASLSSEDASLVSRHSHFQLREWLFAVGLVAAVFLTYQPAWHGQFLWDDDAHVTEPELQSWNGLYRIWFDVKATQQYYPLLHSAFWLQHKLWGDSPLGYHLVNIFLHATAALLVALILRKLAIPGAYFAAAIFALHPVHVESVAWITELKNTLSAVFYLGAAAIYLDFDRTRKNWLYETALALFMLGLLSKTVTATLPAALLVVFWWQRGRLSWRRDALPLVPFFVIGAAAGIFTAWVERTLIGADGEAFALTVVERGLIAGRAIWFYLGKLLWPAELIFIYPRWQIDQTAAWQYAFPAAALLLLGAAWAVRRRSRAPLACLLLFIGTLFPVLGFCNVYPFIYSYVADHFQYLASLSVISLVAAGAALLLLRGGLRRRAIGYAVCLALLATLATLTWRQCRMYANVETLYRTTLDANPGCWLAHHNLGLILAGRKQFDDAMACYEKALEFKPDCADAYLNMGSIRMSQDDYEGAIAMYRKAIEIKPDYSNAYYNLGVVFQDHGKVAEALAHFQKAVEKKPDNARAHYNLGVVLDQQGDTDAAIAHYRKVIDIKPGNAKAHFNLAAALCRKGEGNQAIPHFRRVLELMPDHAETYVSLGIVYGQQGNFDEAMGYLRKALELKPDHAEAHAKLGAALAQQGCLDEAVEHFRKALGADPKHAHASQYLQVIIDQQNRAIESLAQQREAIRARPNDASLLNNAAWELATSPFAAARNGREAVELAQQARRLAGDQEPAVLGTLAAAYAEADRFSEAVETANQALNLATRQKKPALEESIRAKLQLYQSGKPYRQIPQPPASVAPSR